MDEKALLNKYDVIIVGAGPAGCSVAKFLSDKYKVLVVDRLKFPRTKPCGGILVEETQDFIKNWPPPSSIFSYPKYLNLRMIDWNNNLERDNKRKLWNVSRENFDQWLLKKTRNGVYFFSQTKFLHFNKKKNAIEVFLNINSKEVVFKTKYLIAANGPFSSIRKYLRKKPIRYYIAVQYWIKHKGIDDNIYFIYDNEITDFYSWVIPKKESLILGSALEKDDDIKNKMKLLRSKLKKKLGIGGKTIKKEAAILSRPESGKDIFLGSGNIFFVGEAAGLISPSTGEGISFALRSGYNCAKAINEDSQNAFSLYKIFSKDLIKEIKEKTKKANILSDPKKRKKMF